MALTKVSGDMTAAAAMYGVVGCDCKNNSGTPNTQFDLDADAVTLRSSDGSTVVRFNPGAAITNNISTAGSTANGRDQAGAFSNSTAVHFYWIWNGSTLASLSSATAPPTGPTLPSGYTHWAYAGAVFIDGSGNLRKVFIKGSMAFYQIRQLVLNGGTSNPASDADTAIDLDPYVPNNAAFVYLHLRVPTGAGGPVKLRHITGTGNDFFIADLDTNSVGHQASTLMLPITTLVTSKSTIYYRTAGAVTDVWVLGYKVPNGGE